MPKYAYVAKGAPLVADTVPKGWGYDWPYPPADDGPWADPDAPWPPGWPIPPIDPDNPTDTYSVTVSIAALLDDGPEAVLANVFTQAPAPAEFLNHHMMRLDATLDGVTVGIKKLPGDPFVGVIFYEITQHDGVNYGISENIYYNIDATDHGKAIVLTASVATVALPWPTGSDAGTVDMLTCPYPLWPVGAPATVSIAGYVDGSITPCPGCTNYAGALWTGLFTQGGPCGRYGVASNEIDGKRLYEHGDAGIRFDAPNGLWRLELWCQAAPVVQLIWAGAKSNEGTVLGTYTRGSGCDVSPTLGLTTP